MTEPIRILQVFAEMNRGGAETMIMNLYRHIDRGKIQFDFIVHTQEKCAFDEEIEQLGGRIYRVPKYVGKNHLAYNNAWKDFFISHPGYRIIHGHVRSTASIYLKIAKKYNLTTIAHSHSTNSRGNSISRIAKRILQYSIRYKSDYLFACSHEAGLWLFGSRAIKKDNFKIIKNAIDLEKHTFNLEERDYARNELGVGDKIVIGHVGSFTPPKNHDFLIDVFYELSKTSKDYVLLLVGDGYLKNMVFDKVENLGLSDKVIFTGSRSDVYRILKAMDIFVFPSIFEGVPVTLIEAQAMGLPCLISDRITDEIKISSNLKHLSLDDTIKGWVEQISKMKYYDKDQEIYRMIKDKGYDIRESSREYQNLIIEMIKRIEN
ncbi:glycosyltransferase family 1 protein [Irregularibacter muris]|uniref:Glycosyltransferase family 1 protein n=1 Tax=Irregularibacter muris TaxID=1796619 RepID=A0AAE3L387_9FIRM|nr:glycosyltransferase family 1 protein [Irregularibacter muris]MCR1900059.1 glycosyltransferase family 1 protein [Irregularibacter muris]